jgi:hypothetical protein
MIIKLFSNYARDLILNLSIYLFKVCYLIYIDMFQDSDDNRGLASADEDTRERVAKKGGEAPHEKRGLQAADEETRQRVASEGGKASHKNDNKD